LSNRPAKLRRLAAGYLDNIGIPHSQSGTKDRASGYLATWFLHAISLDFELSSCTLVLVAASLPRHSLWQAYRGKTIEFWRAGTTLFLRGSYSTYRLFKNFSTGKEQVREPSSGHELKLPGGEEGGGDWRGGERTNRRAEAEEGTIKERRGCGEYSNKG
jgi:hypothetical protein